MRNIKACRTCDSSAPPINPDGSRNSYKPPGSGHRHYRNSLRKGCQNWLVSLLTVVAFLVLIGLSTGVVLVIVSFFLLLPFRLGSTLHLSYFCFECVNLID